MRQVLSVVLLVAGIWAGWKFLRYAGTEVARHEQGGEATPRYAPGQLPGLPAALEDSLATARRAGVDEFRRWLERHRAEIAEPRLTQIELDFVVLVGGRDPAEARQVLQRIRTRLGPDHPQYRRFQELSRAYP